MSLNWDTRKIPLAFWLGELCLLKKQLLLQSTNVDFVNFNSDLTETPNPPEIDNKASGIMLYSLPIEEEHKPLWKQDGYIHYISQSYRRFYIDLEISYEEYLDQFSSKTRSTFRRKVRKFAKENGGEIDFKLYTSPTEIKEYYSLARSISKETYQEKLLGAGLPEDDGFMADLKRHANAGTARGFILFLDKKPVAYLYMPIVDGMVLYDYVGYLPEVSRLSAGTVLFLKAIKTLFEDELAITFDFTEGYSEQKELFSTHKVHCANLFKLEDNFKNSFLLKSHFALSKISNGLKRLAEIIGIKKILKALIRRTPKQ